MFGTLASGNCWASLISGWVRFALGFCGCGVGVSTCFDERVFAQGALSVREVMLSFEPAFVNQTELVPQSDGSILLTTTGIDSFLEFELPAIEKREELTFLAMEYFSAEGVSRVEIRVRAEGPWPPPIDAGSLDRAEGWVGASFPLTEPGNDFWKGGSAKRIRIDFGQQPGHSLRVRNLRLRSATSEELRGREEAARIREEKQEAARAIREYLERSDWEAECEFRVQGELGIEQTGVVRGRCVNPGEDVWLIERHLHEPSIWQPQRLGDEVKPALVLDTTQCDAAGNFVYQFLTDVRRDMRLLSRWQIVRVDRAKGWMVPLSHARYVESINIAGEETVPPSTDGRNLKGLNGVSPVFGLEELVELGVQHLVLNVVVTNLIDTNPIDGGDTFEFGGKQWWVRPGRLQGLDQMTQFAAKHKISLAAILLLPSAAKDSIIHPEANTAGIYAMPNFAKADGAEKYAAILYYLTQRYSGSEGYGRIDHWILHNEVDFGWVWTNMGEQPLEVFLETYVRSMRIASILSASNNRESRVFISLTHHWNVPEDPRMRTYAPRTMLMRLAEFSKSEGDFQWGVAYHPYPENLFDGRPWLAKTATRDTDTPRITMYNLEVLKNFMDRPEMLDAFGKRRRVLLSEQGYHTAGYGEQAQRQQAAAILYTWQRLHETDFVFSFDYHRWVDAADEGGLLLGLRTLPTPEKRSGEKKLSWDVFRAIGTAEEHIYREKLNEFPLSTK